uniref:Antistasin-like domain-containing protein n=1 Tax=Ciona savignyi TaxID=51511 RepID=H2YUF7_CIOSA
MGRIGLITLVCAVLGSCLIESAFAQDTSCPYHLCTAERLGCTDVGLRRDERGCLLCKCQESVVQPRVCPLHGCTVELLGCVGRKLRKSDNGCTLCECEADNSTLSEGTSDPGTALDRNVVLFRCPQITCT